MNQTFCNICKQSSTEYHFICSRNHNVCTPCIQKLLDINCTACRTNEVIPENLHDKFLFMDYKAKEVSVMEKNFKKYSNCENCKEKPATLFCLRNDNVNLKYYCSECFSILKHTKESPKIRGNELSNNEDEEEEEDVNFHQDIHSIYTFSIKEKEKRLIKSKCNFHLEDNEYYCEDCENTLCLQCISHESTHRYHTVHGIIKYAEKKRSELKEFILPLKEDKSILILKQTQMNNEISKLENRKRKLEEKLLYINETLKNKTTDLFIVNHQVDSINKNSDNLLNTIEDYGVMDLLVKSNTELIRRGIEDVYHFFYPEKKLAARLEERILNKQHAKELEIEENKKIKFAFAEWGKEHEGWHMMSREDFLINWRLFPDEIDVLDENEKVSDVIPVLSDGHYIKTNYGYLSFPSHYNNNLISKKAKLVVGINQNIIFSSLRNENPQISFINHCPSRGYFVLMIKNVPFDGYQYY